MGLANVLQCAGSIFGLAPSLPHVQPVFCFYPLFPRLKSGPTPPGGFWCLGAISACTSVVFSAAFAHLPVFAGGVPTAVQTALSQQQFHSLGLLFTGLALRVCGASRWLQAAGWLMLVGLLLFSFNLYARHVFAWDALRPLVPWGGMAWILAWLVWRWVF
jgi:uncharacterized membrane protein YgdD (TMEM256/DUF423 family)